MSHPKKPRLSWILVVVLVLENPDRFAIRLTEQISSIGLFAVTESQCTEDEHDDEDEDDAKFRNLGLESSSLFIGVRLAKYPGDILAGGSNCLSKSGERGSQDPREFWVENKARTIRCSNWKC
jgi:hypothetical protein